VESEGVYIPKFFIYADKIVRSVAFLHIVNDLKRPSCDTTQTKKEQKAID